MAGCQPLLPGRALAFGTVAVAAGVVSDAQQPAVLALLDMSPEDGGAARYDRRHDATLDPPEPHPTGSTIGLTVAAKDLRHFEPWRHRPSRLVLSP